MEKVFEIKGEHPLDRTTRISSGQSAYSGVRVKEVSWRFVGDDGYEVRIGKCSKKWQFHKLPATELRTCQICGKTSTPKKVRKYCPFTFHQRERYGLEMYNEILTICWSCCNKLRPLEKAINESDRLRLELIKYRKKLNESTKDNAGTA